MKNVSEETGYYSTPIKTEGEIDIKDVSAAKFIHFTNYIKIFASLILLLFGLSSIIVSQDIYKFGEVYFIIGLILSVVGGFALIFSVFAKQKWFIVEYHGGSIAIPVKWYKENDMRLFRKSIFDVKDKSN